tara:strand:+ start:2581 stop:3978 length:1398 start_codon:yes stop_codon:yes gene_type:complete
MADRRSTITGDQIKDGTITSTDISGSVISGQTLITSVDTSNDHLLILDATDGALKKVAPGNLGLGSGGSGISHDGSTADGVLTYKDSDEATVESNLTFDGSTLTVSGDILVNQYIKHNGDENTHINFADNKIILKAGNISFVKVDKKDSAPHEITINDGSNNIDFIVKGNGSNGGNPGMKFDASTNKLGINGVGTPTYELDVAGNIGLHEYIYHNGDDDTFIRFETDNISLSAGGTALTIADGGKVTFPAGFDVGSDAAGDILYHNGTSYVRLAKGSADQVLTMNDAATAPNWENAAGGGGSDTFVMSQAIEQTANMSTGYYYYKAGVGSYIFTNSISTSNFATTFPYWRIGRYATSGVLVVDANLTGYHLTGHKDGSDNDTITLKVWKAPAPSDGASETGTTTLVEMISVELDVNGNQMINKSGTLSSSNSFSAGDQWLITLNATSAYMSSDHYLQLSLKFEPS